MTEAGHVFVMHGDLAKLACDHYLVPTDANRVVTKSWRHGFDVPRADELPPGWGDTGTRVTLPREIGKADDRRTVRWANTGSAPGKDPVSWLIEGVRQALDAAAADLDGRTPRYGRARPLLGMPVFGVGEGGFAKQRGEVLDELLTTAHEVAAAATFDIAFVCWRRSDYAALQSRPARSQLSAGSLTDGRRELADDLGELARDGRLVLFLGAGASVPAGLPGWQTLLDRLAQRMNQQRADGEDLLATAQRLEAADAEGYRSGLQELLGRSEHALGHGLLASLRVDETITTNFDDLYEQACAVPHGAGRLAVLPWDRATAGPWLLKIHGGIGRSHVVFTKADFERFDEQWRPLGAIVQALLMTRHIMFVGYSLSDHHLVTLGQGVTKLLGSMARPDGDATARQVGTVLTLKPEAPATGWGAELRPACFHDGKSETDITGAARLLEIFLDRVAATAAAGEHSYLLDPRYAHLLPPADQALAAKCLSLAGEMADAGPAWAELKDALASLGARTG